MIPEAITTAAQEGRAETVLAWLDADERHDVTVLRTSLTLGRSKKLSGLAKGVRPLIYARNLIGSRPRHSSTASELLEALGPHIDACLARRSFG